MPDMRTCVRVTSKGSITGQLQRALAKRDVLAVRSLAGELPSVPLPLAAEITLLLLEEEPESYAPAARRLLARLAGERAMPLRQLCRRSRDPRQPRGRSSDGRGEEASNSGRERTPLIRLTPG